jgi:uncharacterized membrane protein
MDLNANNNNPGRSCLKSAWRYFLVVSLTFFVVTIAARPIQGHILALYSSSEEDGAVDIHKAFGCIVEAYEAGGNVTSSVKELNEALDLLSETTGATPEQAMALMLRVVQITDGVSNEATGIKDKQVGLLQTEIYMRLITVIVVIFGVILIYRKGPGLYWLLWYKTKKNYIVMMSKNEKETKGESLITSREVLSVVLSVVLLVSVFAYTESYYSTRVIEPFSELAILGPKMMLGDYPGNITVGESIHLNIYIANHLGKPTYYVVMVKLRSNDSVINPAPGSVDATFSHILMNGEEQIIPANITVKNSGQNQRLIFELWVYNSTTDQVEYNNRSTWIWINVLER